MEWIKCTERLPPEQTGVVYERRDCVFFAIRSRWPDSPRFGLGILVRRGYIDGSGALFWVDYADADQDGEPALVDFSDVTHWTKPELPSDA